MKNFGEFCVYPGCCDGTYQEKGKKKQKERKNEKGRWREAIKKEKKKNGHR